MVTLDETNRGIIKQIITENIEKILARAGDYIKELLTEENIDFDKDGVLAYDVFLECLEEWRNSIGFEDFQDKNK